ncbi:MAG: DNA-binding transcriptional regulator [Planctomycetota bacterium]|jgi:LacI family transcriptional regulator
MEGTKKVILNIETSRAYGRGLLHGINVYSIAEGSWSFYQVAGGRDRGLPNLADWGADGAIVRETKDTDKVLSMEVPTVVCVDKNVTSHADITLTTDQQQIAQLAAHHFLERKFKNFAFSGPNRLWWVQERGEHFSKAVADAGFKADVFEHSTPSGKLTWSKAQTRMVQWLQSLPKPVALMAANDDHSQYIVEACKVAGLAVPSEVAVLGVDNDTMVCEFTRPSLSSVHLDTQCAGYHAAELLDKLMRGETVDQREIKVAATHVAARASTDIMAIEDSLVAEAIQYIRSHCRDLVQVSDVADAVSISRSVLDRRFRKAFGSSVQKEIRRLRVEQIAKLLIETDMSITQISMAMHFTGIEHIGRYFKKEMGLSPLQYRKQHKGVTV